MMHKLKTWTIYMIIVFICITLFATHTYATPSPTTASLELLGVRLVDEGDFYGNQDWTKRSQLTRLDIGGRLQVHLKNNAASNVTITGFTLNNKTFDQLSSQSTSNVAETRWWRAWQNPISPGKTATLSIRMVDLVADMPPSSPLTIQTDQGDATFSAPQFNPQTSPLWIPALNVSADLNTTTLFVGNRGSAAMTLQSNGGVAIDGVAFAATLPQTTLAPGDVVPMTLSGTANALEQGIHAIFQVTAQSGETASGGVRVFPYQFAMQSHMQGFNYDDTDRANHFTTGWEQWVPEILDEPSGRGLTPMDVVDDVDSWLTDTSRPDQDRIHDAQTTVHNTSYMEGLVYDDIADIANSHWGNVRQDLASFVTWPKPNWYMPQNTWGQNEGLYLRETWYPLEDVQFQALEAVGHGAKSIQWFLFQNHWRQGWGRREGTEFTRTYQDKNRSGHVSNPLMWSRIGRVSGSLALIKSYLTNSAHLSSVLNENGIEVNTLVSSNNGNPTAVVVLMDHRTPRYGHATGHIFRYDVPRWNQQVLYDQQVQVYLPTYLASSVTHAYVIDPWLGIQDVAINKDGNSISFTIPEVQTGALVLLGSESDGTALRAEWEKTRAIFETYDDVRASMITRAREQPDGTWHVPDATYRQRVTVTNNGSNTADVIAVPIDMSVEREYSTNDTRVVEINGDSATEVSFLLEGTKGYEFYDAADTLSRIKTGCEGDNPSGTSPEGCAMRLENNNGILTAISTYKKAGFVWGIGTIEGQPVDPWTTTEGYPDRWIPARFTTLAIDANITTFPWWWWNYINFYFDDNNDGTIDKSRRLQLYEDATVIYDLGYGWQRFFFDVQEILNNENLYPDQSFHGQYRFGYLHHLQKDWNLEEVDYQWNIDKVSVSSNTALIKPDTAIGAGETRTYEVYYDVKENARASQSPKYDTTLANATISSDVDINKEAVDIAGVSVTINDTSVTINTQSRIKKLLVRHLGNDGSIVSAETLTSASDVQTFQTTLSRTLAQGEVLVCMPIQLGGEGQVFAFNSSGEAISGDVPQATVKPAMWQKLLQTDYANEETDLFPLSVDISSDGERIAVSMIQVKTDRSDTTGLVRVFNAAGNLVLEKDFPGKVFYVRFAPGTYDLYVAANFGEDVIDSSGDYVLNLYEDTRIHKYSATGDLLWEHKVGSNTPAENPGRTVFDMEVYPNGDVLYSEWNSYGVKLQSSDGQVVWSAQTSAGGTSYTPAVVPLDDGGALLIGLYTKHIKPDGSKRNHIFVNNEFPVSIDGSKDGTVWAFVGNVLRIVKNLPDGEDYRISGEGSNMTTLPDGIQVGRYPRIVRVSDDGAYVAVGTSDGKFKLFSNDTTLLWEKTNGASYVTDIRFLPDGSGVVFARDVLDYQHDNIQTASSKNGWQYRDTVEAYDMEGNALWRHEGGWRTHSRSEPFMNMFAINTDATRLAVLTGDQMRYIDLSAQDVPNSTLYPVEDPLGTGGEVPDAPIVAPSTVQIKGTENGFISQDYVFTANVSPSSATKPISYTWYLSATNQDKPVIVTHNNQSSLTDDITYSWNITSTNYISVTATNAGGSVSSALHTMDITAQSPNTGGDYRLYVPIVSRLE